MKQLLAILLTLTLVLSFGGCAGEKRTAPADPPSQSGSVSVMPPEPIMSTSSSNHITADLGNNITLAAEVQRPADGTAFDIYQAEVFVFDRETVCNILLGEGWKINDAIPTAEGIEYFICGEKQLFLYGGGRDGFNLSTGEGPSIAAIYDIAPTDPTEPDFMTAGDATKLVRDTLISLGLETQVIKCTPLTQEAISALTQAFQTDYGGDPAEYENCPPCYVIDLCQVVDGIPVCNTDIQLTHGGVDTPSAFAAQPNIQAVVTAEGLYDLTALACLQVGEKVQTGVTPLSEEKVIGLVQKSYEDIINTSPITIQSMALQYAAIPLSLNDKTRQLRPVWVVEGTENLQYESASKREKDIDWTRPLTLFFDAVTGQQVEDSFR